MRLVHLGLLLVFALMMGWAEWSKPLRVLGQQAPAGDQAKLQGKWKGWVVNDKGENPEQGPVHLELTVQGDEIKAKQLNPGADPNLGEGTFKLALMGDKRHIDAVRTSTPGKGQTYAGIYQIDGDTWKWCTGTPKRPRPEDFATRKGQFLLILKRQK
ncbi:MAG: TIGR03067 domain-containing protein [Gemmataceae bacterium]